MIHETTGVFKTQQLEPLETGKARYIMAADGIYYEQNDDLFHASTLVKEFYNPLNFGTMSMLKGTEFFEPRFPILPKKLLEQCLGFFTRIELTHDAECGLVLLYNPDTMEYSWCCPEQEGGGWDLKFTVPVPGKDYDERLVHFGDVHLHPGMAAYHSGTDHKDEMTASDGLHLVVGTPKSWGEWDNKQKKYIQAEDQPKKPNEYCAVFVSDGNRFKIDPALVFETMDLTPKNFPGSWLSKFTKAKKGAGFSYGI